MNALIAMFVRNGVAANLLMVLIGVGGLVMMPNLKREVFPEIKANQITVTVPYPGATPEEVEEGICIRVEEAVQSLEGVERVRSTALEGSGTVTIEALDGADIRALLDDVKARVDAIDTFPGEAEEPVIQEAVTVSQVINVAVSGPADELSVKRLGERVRDEILALPGITQVELVNVRPYEISIEVSEEALRRHGLSFTQVANAVRRTSLDLPGGSLKTAGGEILLRTKGQAYTGEEFARVPVLTRPDGTLVLLGDVAAIRDGFAETDQTSRFDDQPSAMIQVFRVGDQDAVAIADAVKEYVADAEGRMPEGMRLTVWQDASDVLKSRQNLLIRNGLMGFVLVFVVLALFLRFQLAFWVSLGIPISFLGAFLVMPWLDVSINLISLFAFILVLGIVVDDAIVVGESIFHRTETGLGGAEAAIRGSHDVAIPVTASVLTTVAAFVPLLFVPGTIGQVMRMIPLVVIPTLLASLVESKLILPYHLSHLRPRVPGTDRPHGVFGAWTRLRHAVARGLDWVVQRTYIPSVRFAVRWRYVTAASFTGILILTVGLVAGGYVKFVFFTQVEADSVTARLAMPLGTSVTMTEAAVDRIERAALDLRDELAREQAPGELPVIRHILASVGSQPISQRQASSGPQGSGGGVFSSSHLGEVAIELAPAEERAVTSAEIARMLRERIGAIPGADELTFSSSLFAAGEAINIQLAGPDVDELASMGDKLKTALADYAGVFDITDSYEEGKQEVKFRIKPEAEALGLTMADLALQVRQGFYGEEAQRIQRGRDEVKVMVRYPEESRRSLAGLESMRIRTPAGDEVPLAAVADATIGRSYSAIYRTDRMRTLSVLADVDEDKANANEILADVQAKVLPGLLADHPSVTYSLEGEQQQQAETRGGLLRGFLFALIVIYALIAIPLRSYLQPVVIMSAVPFGLIGAVWGHWLLGRDLSILSVFGLVALTGVVVNDAIVLLDTINGMRAEGMNLYDAVTQAGRRRFRPILLTSLTTVAGLMPMMLERSMQAQFLIPIAITLSFGVLFSTFITLVAVPAGYTILEDFLGLFRRSGAAGGIEKTAPAFAAGEGRSE